MNNIRNIGQYVKYIDGMEINTRHITDNGDFKGAQKKSDDMEITKTQILFKLNDEFVKEKLNRKFLYAIG